MAMDELWALFLTLAFKMQCVKFVGAWSNVLESLRAKPAALITNYHTRDFVEEEKNGCPIRQPFIYRSTLCGVDSQITTPIIPPNNISSILQAQPVTKMSNHKPCPHVFNAISAL